MSDSFSRHVELVTDLVLVTSRAGALDALNPAAVSFFGAAADQLVGSWIHDLIHPEDLESILWEFEDSGRRTIRSLVRARDQASNWKIFDVVVDLDQVTGKLHWSWRDVTEQRRALDELSWQASHDRLTGLPNLGGIAATAGYLIETDQPFTVLLIDPDRYRKVGSAFGPAVSEGVLASIGGRLEQAVRDGDIVGHLGGDQFVVLLSGSLHGEDLAVVLDRIKAVFDEPFSIHGHRVELQSTLGAVRRESQASWDDLLRDATAALSSAKTARQPVAVFGDEMREAGLRRLLIEGELRQAINERAFSIAYQPLVRLSDRAVVGFEALVRWEHPTRGRLMPAAFIGVADRAGLAPAIGQGVLYGSLRRLRQWHQGDPGLLMAINLSPGQLRDPAMISDLDTALTETGVSPDRLVMEISERTVDDDPDLIVRRVDDLKALGVQIALDDLGVGSMSLRQVRDLRFDLIKLDPSLCARVVEDDAVRASLAAVVRLVDGIGGRTLAEAVESHLEADVLAGLGIEMAQGALFGLPAPAPDIDRLLSDGSMSAVG